MKVVIQRSNKSIVSVDGKIVGNIDSGLVVLSCFTFNDTVEDIDYIVKKLVNLRIFDDEQGIMNKSIIDKNGSILSISQFTLYADTKKGNRPSYNKALPSSESSQLFDLFNNKLKEYVDVQTGVFGAEMLVSIENDGPVTIIIDSKEK